MNILELCLSPSLGGLELYAYQSATALAAREHRVLALVRDKLWQHFRSHESSVNVIEGKRRSKHLPLFSARSTARIIDHNDIDVIHVHWVKDLPLAVFAKLFSKKRPAIVYTRQMQITRRKTDPYHRFIYRHVDMILGITEQLTRDLRTMIGEHYTGDIRTLYHGVTEPAIILDVQQRLARRAHLGFATEDFIIGQFGRIERDKGQHLLIQAVAAAKAHGIELKCLVVGHEMQPGYTAELQQLAGELGIAAHIVFHDFVSQPQQLMQACDCVVLATLEETFGLVLPEAMRAGVAVVGSNRGGVTEIIEHEHSGLLFESGDADSLAQQLMRLQQDAALRSTLAMNGKHKADKVFNHDTHLEQLEALLQASIAKQT